MIRLHSFEFLTLFEQLRDGQEVKLGDLLAGGPADGQLAAVLSWPGKEDRGAPGKRRATKK